MKLVKNNNKKSKTISNSNYDPSKHNALKYGIFSEHAVMKWENQDDYDSLLNDLISEYQPNHVTERHLITDIANILWRKKRLRHAEKTSYQEVLNDNVNGHYSTGKAEQALLDDKSTVEDFDMKKAVVLNNAETKLELSSAKEYLTSCNKSIDILTETGVYEDGLTALPQDDRDDWEDEEGGLKGSKYGDFNDRCNYENTTESLLYWVSLAVDHYESLVYELENRDKVKAQVLGSVFLSDKTMDKYIRYENHLDKKYEKTLAMFFRLRDIRNNGGTSKSVL